MIHSISSLVPNATDLLSLEVEELAGVLLVYLNSVEDSTISQGDFNLHNFFNAPPRRDYEDRQEEVNRALMEAWAWLQSDALLVERATPMGDFFFISRRGKGITSRSGFSSYRRGSLLPKGQLHPLIAGRVYPAFLRGEYDTAVFQAYREVEIAVRSGGKFSPDDYGTDLMREAFKPASKRGVPQAAGPLTDAHLPTAEQEAMANLFAGAIGLYKNPQSHRQIPTQPEDAAEVIGFASQLLRIVDRLKP